MDLYHIWCDLKPGVKDSVLVEAARKYLGHLKSEGSIENWRLTRRKLGLGPAAVSWRVHVANRKAIRRTNDDGNLVSADTGWFSTV